MKKILTTAVTLAISLPAVSFAGSPTLYGKIHMSINNNDNHSSGTAKYNEWNMATRGSRIGVKGSEDMGNGLKVGYLMEWQVDMNGNNSSNALKSRNRAITLSGSWGTFLAGKWDTPMKVLGSKLAVFRDRVGDIRNLGVSSVTATSSKISTIDQRPNNTIAYVTPNINGFSSTIAYIFDAGQGQTTASGQNSDNNAWSADALYTNGPIFLGAAYVTYNSDGRTPGTNVDDASTWRIGGSYKFGDLKVIADYTDMESANYTKDFDPSIWKIGAAYKMGNNTIRFHYAERDESGLRSSKCTGGLASSKCKDGADMWVVGVDHKMSRRTLVYALYASANNDDDSRSTVWLNTAGKGQGAAPSAGNDATSFSVGIKHNF